MQAAASALGGASCAGATTLPLGACAGTAALLCVSAAGGAAAPPAAPAPPAAASQAGEALRASAARVLSAAEEEADAAVAVLPTSPQRLPRAPSPPSGAASDSGRQLSGAALPARQAPAAADVPPAPAARKGAGACQVCQADLAYSKAYHQRYKICEEHMKAAKVLVEGSLQRFCQQCGRFHAVSAFDAGCRSCRRELEAHNRRRRKQARSRALQAAVASGGMTADEAAAAAAGAPGRAWGAGGTRPAGSRPAKPPLRYAPPAGDASASDDATNDPTGALGALAALAGVGARGGGGAFAPTPAPAQQRRRGRDDYGYDAQPQAPPKRLAAHAVAGALAGGAYLPQAGPHASLGAMLAAQARHAAAPHSGIPPVPVGASLEALLASIPPDAVAGLLRAVLSQASAAALWQQQQQAAAAARAAAQQPLVSAMATAMAAALCARPGAAVQALEALGFSAQQTQAASAALQHMAPQQPPPPPHEQP